MKETKKEIKLDTSNPKHLAIIGGVFMGLVITTITASSIYFHSYKWNWRSPIILRSPFTVEKIQELKQVEEVKEEIKKIELKDVEIEVTEVKEETKMAKVTAYSCGGIKTDAERMMNCPSTFGNKEPKTATGSTPIAYKTVACDPNNIGKRFWLDINGGIEVVCEDRGSAITGSSRFDIYLPTIQEAREFGVKNIAYKLIE